MTGTGCTSTPIVIELTPPTSPVAPRRPMGRARSSHLHPDQVVPNPIGNWIVTFTQQNGCSDSVTIPVGIGPTPAPSPSGLPDAAMAESATAPSATVVALILAVAILLGLAVVRGRRSA